MHFDANAGIHREPAVTVSEHFFGFVTHPQPSCAEGVQRKPAQAGLHLEQDVCIHASNRTENTAREGGLFVRISIARHLRKDAALQIFAKALANTGFGGSVITRALELTGTG